MDNSEYLIEINHLIKSYNDVKAVNDISLKVKRGSLFAFLGINGAGKSTTINIIANILSKDSGDVIIDGYNLDKDSNMIKSEIGIVFQTSVLDELLTVEENLRTRASFYGIKKSIVNERIKKISEMLNLDSIMKRQVKKLSGGQKRRVDIARSIIHEPKLLILDEPTTGLDPKTRIDVWKLINDIRLKNNMTVFLTTHYLEEAEKATYVTIMNKGEIIAEGTPTSLKNRYSSDSVIVYHDKEKTYDLAFKDYKYKYSKDQKAYIVKLKDSLESFNFLTKYKDLITDFEVKKGDMDDVFLNVTGQNIIDSEGNEDE